MTVRFIARCKQAESLPQGAPAGYYEHMTSAKWKQTLKDIPVAILASGVGYGVGRTMAELVAKRLVETGERPGWLRALPVATSIGGGALAMGHAAAQSKLRNRREAAERRTKP